MKKTVLATPLLPQPGTTRLRQRRQVGSGPGRQSANWCYLSYTRPSLVAVASLSHPHYGLSSGQAVRCNNVAGSCVTTSPPAANRSATYANSTRHNRQCNYSVEGGIPASKHYLAAAAAPGRATSIRPTAQAASFCPDSEPLSNFSKLLASSVINYHLITLALWVSTPSASQSQLVARSRPVRRVFWIFPS